MESYNNQLQNKLNNLLTKNYDAEAGFKKVAEHLSAGTLKDSFLRKAEQRSEFGQEIKNELKTYGMEPEKGTSVKADLHRAWIDVKAVLSLETEDSMIEEVVRGEKTALEEYQEVINDTALLKPTKELLEKQMSTISMSLEVSSALEEMS